MGESILSRVDESETVSQRQYQVIAGPYRVARRYAASLGLSEDQYLIVTRGHQLARLDPAMIASIVTVKLSTLTTNIMQEIHDEIDRLQVLWPVPITAAA